MVNVAWLESCVLEDKANTSTPKPTREIEVVQSLPKESILGNPTKVALLSEGASTMTFRFWPVPSSVVWTAYVVYQAKAPIKTALTNTWAPFPDELAYVYRQGFLAMALMHADDIRATQEYQKFQLMIVKALGQKDAELQHEGWFPDRPLMIG